LEGHRITEVEEGSIAKELELEKGDILLSINGSEIIDVLDYIEFMEAEELELLVQKADGEEWEIEIEKEPGQDLGLKFEHDLMDKERVCRNKCIFCFVDQLPKGMRETLYYKDDDWRLSFLSGNYITLTNLSDCDVDRILEKKISPLYVSVHTTNPDLRKRMLNNRFAGDVLKYLYKMADGGVKLHTQIVLCPGWNDGPELDRTLADLWKLKESVQSVAVVPVGLTSHREKLEAIKPFTLKSAAKVIDQVERWQRSIRSRHDTSFVYAADEFYILANRKLPALEDYDEMHQLENGVGLVVQFQHEFEDALSYILKERIEIKAENIKKHTIITGKSAEKVLSEMVSRLNRVFGLSNQVVAVENRLFGLSVTVAGLLSGSDIYEGTKGRDLGEEILIPQVMLRKGEDVFLDGWTLSRLIEKTGLPVVPVPVRGDLFLYKLLNIPFGEVE
jgi:putative radical SAM enzyme (TIGR03279 family)